MTLAVLTPIGQGHLESAEAERMDSVVFGTNAWQFWRSCMADPGPDSPMLFYESWGPAIRQAAWTATFRDDSEQSSGYPPKDWKKFREPIAAAEDAQGHVLGPGFFSGYYLAEGIKRLQPPVPFSRLRLPESGRKLASNFLPIGPILVVM